VYGRTLNYAKDPEVAKTLRILTAGYETISDAMMEGLVALGYTMKEVLPPKNA